MEGSRSLDEIYVFYREDAVTEYCRSTMLQFLDLVADVFCRVENSPAALVELLARLKV